MSSRARHLRRRTIVRSGSARLDGPGLAAAGDAGVDDNSPLSLHFDALKEQLLCTVVARKHNHQRERHLCLTLKQNVFFVHKCKVSSSSISIGRTWKLKHLSRIGVEGTTFTLVFDHPYRFVTHEMPRFYGFALSCVQICKERYNSELSLDGVSMKDLESGDLSDTAAVQFVLGHGAREQLDSATDELTASQVLGPREREILQEAFEAARVDVKFIDSLAERLDLQLHSLEEANIHALLASEDAVQHVLTKLASVENDLESVGEVLGMYREELEIMNTDLLDIESMNDTLAVQNGNLSTLSDELTKLLTSLKIADDDLRVIEQPAKSMITSTAMQKCLGVAQRLDRMISMAGFEWARDMNAVRSKVKEASAQRATLRDGIVGFIKRRMSQQAEKFLATRKADKAARKRLIYEGLSAYFDDIRKFGDFVNWIGSFDRAAVLDLRNHFIEAFHPVVDRLFRDFLDAHRVVRPPRRPMPLVGSARPEAYADCMQDLADMDEAFSSQRVESIESLSLLSFVAHSLRVVCDVSHSLSMFVSAMFSPLEAAGDDAPSSAASSGTNTPSTPLPAAPAPASAAAAAAAAAAASLSPSAALSPSAVTSPSAAAAAAAAAHADPLRDYAPLPALMLLCSELIKELPVAIDAAMRADALAAIKFLAYVDRLEEMYSSSKLVCWVLLRMRKVFAESIDKSMDAQRGSLDEKVAVKTAGVLRATRNATELARFCFEIKPPRHQPSVQSVSQQTLTTMLDWLSRVVALNPKYEHVCSFENLVFVAEQLRPFQSRLEPEFVARYESLARSHLDSYVLQLLEYKLGKLTAFVIGARNLAASMPMRDIQFQSNFSKQAFLRLLTSHPASSFKSALQGLYTRMLKHLSASEQRHLVVWRRCQATVKEHLQFLERLAAECYETRGIAPCLSSAEVADLFEPYVVKLDTR